MNVKNLMDHAADGFNYYLLYKKIFLDIMYIAFLQSKIVRLNLDTLT